MEKPILFYRRRGKGVQVLICPAHFTPKSLKKIERAKFKEERGAYGDCMVMLPARCSSCAFLERCVRFWNEEGASPRAIARFLGVPVGLVKDILAQSLAKRSSK